MFYIDSSTGIVTTNTVLDLDKGDKFTLEVLAHDLGIYQGAAYQLTGSATLTVNVVHDVDDSEKGL